MSNLSKLLQQYGFAKPEDVQAAVNMKPAAAAKATPLPPRTAKAPSLKKVEPEKVRPILPLEGYSEGDDVVLAISTPSDFYVDFDTGKPEILSGGSYTGKIVSREKRVLWFSFDYRGVNLTRTVAGILQFPDKFTLTPAP